MRVPDLEHLVSEVEQNLRTTQVSTIKAFINNFSAWDHHRAWYDETELLVRCNQAVRDGARVVEGFDIDEQGRQAHLLYEILVRQYHEEHHPQDTRHFSTEIIMNYIRAMKPWSES